MRILLVLLCFAAAPAWAHHEVTVVASALPLFFGLASIFAAGVAVWREKLRRTKARRRR